MRGFVRIHASPSAPDPLLPVAGLDPPAVPQPLQVPVAVAAEFPRVVTAVVYRPLVLHLLPVAPAVAVLRLVLPEAVPPPVAVLLSVVLLLQPRPASVLLQLRLHLPPLRPPAPRVQ